MEIPAHPLDVGKGGLRAAKASSVKSLTPTVLRTDLSEVRLVVAPVAQQANVAYEIMVMENNSAGDTTAVVRSCAAAKVRCGRVITSYGES
jgi:hypothetical protein